LPPCPLANTSIVFYRLKVINKPYKIFFKVALSPLASQEFCRDKVRNKNIFQVVFPLPRF
jgi:hypothetical protein